MSSQWQANRFKIRFVDAEISEIEGITSGYWGIQEKSKSKSILTYLGPSSSGLSVTDQGNKMELQELAERLNACLNEDGSILYLDLMKRIVNAHNKSIRSRNS
jgi:hypothetical protein